ncbi:hypothetical protein AALB_3912 [Agarivorans albus MKT 106]|uniref:Uncharacterized protein n=1 Tax=Agarivorans albus MKT 106 TaxID=1331007 RepID=R9PR37_AGAAL|nr:hypothetical protein AALB_3912 [Agarivorans albus MKT 106]
MKDYLALLRVRLSLDLLGQKLAPDAPLKLETAIIFTSTT